MPEPLENSNKPLRIAFIGFGEAGAAFAAGWRANGAPVSLGGYDVKLDDADDEVSAVKRNEFAGSGVEAFTDLVSAVQGADVVFSLVTADKAREAASEAARIDLEGALFFDGNSCAPETKRQSATVITRANGRYVDCAIMAPVFPKRHQTPLILSGPHAEAALEVGVRLGLSAQIQPGDVGAASSVKMVRSIMMKGLEALMTECVLAGRVAGVEREVLASLEATYPGFDWTKRAAYMLERSMTHGVRRAAEMREVVRTIKDLGLPSDMAQGAVAWQQRVGDLALNCADLEPDYGARSDALLKALAPRKGERRKTDGG